MVLTASNITAETGLPLDGDGDGTGGGDFIQTLVVAIAGDADLDLNVDITDFNALAVNYDPHGDNPGNDWLQGNFDGDADIDFSDFKSLLFNLSPEGYATSPIHLSQSLDSSRMTELSPVLVEPLTARPSLRDSTEVFSVTRQVTESAVDVSFADLGNPRTDMRTADETSFVRRSRFSVRHVEEKPNRYHGKQWLA